MSKVIYAEDLYNKSLQCFLDDGSSVLKSYSGKTKKEVVTPLIKYLKTRGIEVRSRQEDKKNKQGTYSDH